MASNKTHLLFAFLVVVILIVWIISLAANGMTISAINQNSVAMDKQKLKMINGLSIIANLIYVGIVGYFAYNYCYKNSSFNYNELHNTSRTLSTKVNNMSRPHMAQEGMDLHRRSVNDDNSRQVDGPYDRKQDMSNSSFTSHQTEPYAF